MEAEYEARISRMEAETSTQLSRTRTAMNELDQKVNLAERRAARNQEGLDLLNGRLDEYLARLKGDLDTMASRNMKLFSQFMDASKEVDRKYEEFNRKMEEQYTFFAENKERYQDCLDKLQGIETQITTQAQAKDEQIARVRACVDELGERISQRDRQNNDMYE